MIRKRLLYEDGKGYLGLVFPLVDYSLVKWLYQEQLHYPYMYGYEKIREEGDLIVVYSPWDNYLDRHGIHGVVTGDRQEIARSLLPLFGYFAANGYYFDPMQSLFIIEDDRISLGPHQIIDDYRQYRRGYIRFLLSLIRDDWSITDDDLTRYPLNRYLTHLTHQERVFWGETLTARFLPLPHPLRSPPLPASLPLPSPRPGFRNNLKKIYHHYVKKKGLVETMMRAFDYYYQGFEVFSVEDAITLADTLAPPAPPITSSAIARLLATIQLLDVSNPYWSIIVTIEHFTYVLTTVVLNHDSTVYERVNLEELTRWFMRTAHQGTVLNRGITITELTELL